MLSLEHINHIKKHITTTKCGDTAEFLCAALSNKWSDIELKQGGEYYNPNWCSIHYGKEDTQLYIWFIMNSKESNRCHINSTLEDLFSKINNSLNNNGYVWIELDMFDNINVNLEHSMIWCDTDKGKYIIDSYIRQREPEIRELNWCDFESLVKDPTISNWNKLCKSQEKDIIEGSIEIEITIRYLETDKLMKN